MKRKKYRNDRSDLRVISEFDFQIGKGKGAG